MASKPGEGDAEPAFGWRLCFAFALVALTTVAGLFEAYGFWYVTVLLCVVIVVVVLRTHRRWSGKSVR